ncbi:MAG TPA: hypothetical protein VGK73_12475 [Polyangiaceae bacterium]
MTIHRILITKLVESELAIELDANDAPEAERLARERVPTKPEDWDETREETFVKAEAKP